MKKRMCIMVVLCLLLFVMNLPVSAAGVGINKNSITLETGETYQLYATVDGTKTKAQAWGTSDSSVATINQSGKVTAKGKGSAVITGMVNGSTVECLVSVVEKTSSTTTRYNVLILDMSGSVKGTALKREKEAAKRFCRTVLKADGKNYLALVSLSSEAKVVCSFTKKYDKLEKAISGIKSGGGTNMNHAFKQADKLLSSVASGKNIIKNVILCSDGLPKNGTKSSGGRYTKKDHKYYKYANAVYKTDVKMKKKNYFIYALGFFHNSEGNDLKFGKVLMPDLASKNRYYVVQNLKDIDKVLQKIAGTIKETTKNEPQQSTTTNKTPAASIRLNKSKMTIYVGKSETLKATVKGKSSKVTWKSSNSKIAKVNKNGKVTGVNQGKATITATANGKKATCTVTVAIKHPTYSQYFMVKAQKSKYGSALIDEYGIRLITNKEAVIKKCGVYVQKQSDGTYKRTMACTGSNITSATFVPYLARKGKIKYEGGKTSNINTFTMRKGSSGVWSLYGNYTLTRANLEDANGRELAVKSTGVAGKNTRIFNDLDAMKKWLSK